MLLISREELNSVYECPGDLLADLTQVDRPDFLLAHFRSVSYNRCYYNYY